MAVSKRLRRNAGALLAVPAVLLVVAVILIPMGMVAKDALRSDGTWSLDNFRAVFTEPPYSQVFRNTIEMSLEITILCLALALPVALAASRRGGRFAAVVILLIATSFWVSLLVRTYGWFIVLGHSGPIARAGRALGVDIELLYTRPGTLIAMVNVMLPITCLPLIGFALRAIDWTLVDAAEALGARRLRVLFRVLLPQLYPGLLASAVLTFIVSLGFFVTPQLIGSPRDTMIAQTIYLELNELYDTPRASAVSLTLLALIVVVAAVYFAVVVLVRRRARRFERELTREAFA